MIGQWTGSPHLLPQEIAIPRLDINNVHATSSAESRSTHHSPIRTLPLLGLSIIGRKGDSHTFFSHCGAQRGRHTACAARCCKSIDTFSLVNLVLTGIPISCHATSPTMTTATAILLLLLFLFSVTVGQSADPGFPRYGILDIIRIASQGSWE